MTNHTGDMMARTAHIVRETSESHIDLELNLDGTGKTDIDTSVPFYNHMMTALGKHSLIDLTIHAHGDTDIDVHHTVEDTAIVFGEALKQALGDKKGIRRFADATVPLDEALAKAVVDISGRPYCVCSGEPEGYEFCMIGGHFTGSLVRHVMESIAFHAGICLHMQVLAGRDPHHIAEAEFKALARALRFAVEIDKENRRLSLGHKQLEENPWDVFETVFTVGSVHEGTIIEMLDKGAVVALPYGVEGFATPKHLVKEDGSQAQLDEKLSFKVIEFNKDAKRIILSHSRIFEDAAKAEERAEKKAASNAKKTTKREEAPAIQNQAASTTLGDIDALAALKEQLENKKK